MTSGTSRSRQIAVTILVLLGLFGIPAVLLRVTFDNVPQRSEIKSRAIYFNAINVVEGTLAKHREVQSDGRLQALPANAHDWIVLINPMGRKAPGGGPAVLHVPNPETGATGLTTDGQKITITLPAYRHLTQEQTVLSYRSLLPVDPVQ